MIERGERKYAVTCRRGGEDAENDRNAGRFDSLGRAKDAALAWVLKEGARRLRASDKLPQGACKAVGMSGAYSRNKGKRGELELVHMFRDNLGIACNRNYKQVAEAQHGDIGRLRRPVSGRS